MVVFSSGMRGMVGQCVFRKEALFDLFPALQLADLGLCAHPFFHQPAILGDGRPPTAQPRKGLDFRGAVNGLWHRDAQHDLPDVGQPL